MRYASIRNFDITNGEGIGVALFVQGCPFHCKGCFNECTWDFDGGEEWTEEVQEKFFEFVNQPFIERVTILGGEPMDWHSYPDVKEIVKRIRSERPDIKIWLYTGYDFEYLTQYNDGRDEIFEYIDIMVDGQFIEKQRDLTLPFRGSANQRIIDINKSKAIGLSKAILWGDNNE